MRPFEDIDVLDLTQSIAGPVATQYLGALGANVVKLEPPDGDTFRSVLGGAMFAATNLGGKRSISVDLKTEEGREIGRDLAASADVVIESFRPGVAEDLGMDYETVAAENEDVIHCSITGFGKGGPYEDRPAYDPIVQATSGVMSTIGYPDRPPVRVGTSVTDYGTGMSAAFGVASALYERAKTGEGRAIDVSMYDIGISWMGYWIAHYSGTGEVPDRSGAGFASLAPYDVFTAAEGELVYVCALNNRLFERLCRAIDRPDLLADDRFVDNDSRWEHRDVLEAELEDTFGEYERESLVETLASAGVPAGPVRTVDEVVDEDPHVRARDGLAESYNPHADRTVETAAVPLSTPEGRVDAKGRPPVLGEHTRSVLREHGYDEATIDRLLEADVVRSSDAPEESSE